MRGRWKRWGPGWNPEVVDFDIRPSNWNALLPEPGAKRPSLLHLAGVIIETRALARAARVQPLAEVVEAAFALVTHTLRDALADA